MSDVRAGFTEGTLRSKPRCVAIVALTAALALAVANPAAASSENRYVPSNAADTRPNVAAQLTLPTSEDVSNALFTADAGTDCRPFVQSITITAVDASLVQVAGSYGAASFPREGSSFLLLSSGDPFAPRENGDLDAPPAFSCNGDVARVDIAFNFPAGTTQSLGFDFDMFSYEFPEFVGSQFNDYVFAYLDGAPINLDASCNPVAGGGCLLTRDTQGNQTNVNNAFFQPCNQIGCDVMGQPGWTLVFDDPPGQAAPGTDAGRTGTLTTCSPISCPPGPVTPGAHTLTFIVGDVVDGVYTTVGLFDNVRCFSDLVCSTVVTCPEGCDDGDVCNGTETCAGGTCQPGTPLGCSDGDPCTTDGCVPASGCSFPPVVCPSMQQCDPANGNCVGAEATPSPTFPADTPTLSPTAVSPTATPAPPTATEAPPTATEAPPTATHTPPPPTATGTASASTTPTHTATTTGTSTESPTVAPTPTLAPPLLQVSPASGSFGKVFVGHSRRQNFVIRNVGGPLLAGTAVVACEGFSVAPASFADLGAGAQTTVIVTFTPASPGVYVCDLIVESNGGDAQIPLSGSAEPPPPIPLVPSPASPAGVALVLLLSAAMLWALRGRRA